MVLRTFRTWYGRFTHLPTPVAKGEAIIIFHTILVSSYHITIRALKSINRTQGTL